MRRIVHDDLRHVEVEPMIDHHRDGSAAHGLRNEVMRIETFAL